MIIKKPKFNTATLKRDSWPFTVPEVTVVASTIESNGKNLVAFGLVHNFKIYALSGALTSYGVEALEKSGIWKQSGPIIKTSETTGQVTMEPLDAFFAHVKQLYERSLK